jgi:tetratricopeptide (TPR) repeat protein
MAAELVYEIQVFGNMTPPCTGRYSHLHGRFQPQGDDPGAVKWYLDARVADDDIAKLGFSTTARERIGFLKHEGESDESFNNRIAAASSRLQRVKSQATIWLSQIHYEKGEFGQTENWLQKIDAKDDDPNHGQIQYNLARAYEALGRIDDARRIYLLDESPQKLGNRLRAEMLRKLPTT